MATLGRQLFADRRRRISDLVDQLLKLIAVHAEFPSPIFDLMGFVHVDLAAARRPFLTKIADVSTSRDGQLIILKGLSSSAPAGVLPPVEVFLASGRSKSADKSPN
jgi:hypothetical protein